MENIEQENTQETQQEIPSTDEQSPIKVVQLVLPKKALEKIEQIKRKYNEMEMRDNV